MSEVTAETEPQSRRVPLSTLGRLPDRRDDHLATFVNFAGWRRPQYGVYQCRIAQMGKLDLWWCQREQSTTP